MAVTNETTVGEILEEVTKEAWQLVQKGENLSPREHLRLQKANAILEAFKEITRVVLEGECSRAEAWYLSKRLNELYDSFKQS